MTFAGDEYGTLVEVYPLGMKMIPGKDSEAIQYIATHAAISIPLNQSQIEFIEKSKIL